MISSKKKLKKGNAFKELTESYRQLIANPERFLKPQPEKYEAFVDFIQQTYAASIGGDFENKDEVLPELVVAEMDDEQIWQQLEIRNNLVFEELLKQTAQLTAIKEKHLGIELDEEGQDEEPEDEEAEEHELSENEENGLEEDETEEAPVQHKKKTKSGKKIRKSVVDDTFFKLDEMKEFLEQEDAKEMRKMNNKSHKNEDDEGIDYFAEDFGVGDEEDSEEEDVNINYADFFDMDEELEKEAQKMQKGKGKQKDFFNEQENDSEPEEPEEEGDEENENEEGTAGEEEDAEEQASEIDEDEFVAKSGLQPASDSEEDSEEEERTKKPEPVSQSSNELREARLMQRIRDYEEVVLGEKPWQLKGEIKAASRPQNSLLEEILEFESTTRPTAPMTEETNISIEDLIKRRIRDKAWDDVVATVRPTHTPQEYRKQLVLDQEKSKQSLAQVYEQEYQKEMDKLNPQNSDEYAAAPDPKEHQEIRKAMRSLFLKLDALTNFHFTPKPVAPEIKIVTNTPAIHMEEVAPLAMSDAKLLAPEEVFRGPKQMPMGKSERTRTDKNRERRKKKQKQRAINAAIESREKEQAKQGKGPTQREANAKLLKSITKNRNVEKITSSHDQGSLKSSKAFFSKLQDTQSGSTGQKRPKKDLASKANAKKLKL